MARISHRYLLISIAIMIAVVAAACDSPASKPTAEPDPPTPIPTVVTESESTTEDSTANVNTSRQSFAEAAAQECLAGELDFEIDPATGLFDRGLLREVDAADLVAAFETCGVEQGGRQAGGGGRIGGGFVGSGIADPEVRECLTEEMGEDALDNLGQGSGIGLGEEWVAAFEKCGLSSGDGAIPFSGGRGGFAGGGAFADPEIQECLSTELGEDFGSGGGIFGGLTGGGPSEELTAAFEECGINLSAGFTGRIGGGGGFGGGGFGGGGRGGFGGDGSFQECLTEALGEDALLQLRNPEGPPSAELQEAFQECGDAVAIPVEPDGGTGDGAGPIPGEPTATPIPVSDLTVEQLTCLSSELEPADLAGAVVATSSGDLSEVSDTVLAALQACGVGS